MAAWPPVGGGESWLERIGRLFDPEPSFISERH
jgi:hypothetical protein